MSQARNHEKGHVEQLVQAAGEEVDKMYLRAPESINAVHLYRRQQILEAVHSRLLKIVNDESTYGGDRGKAALLEIKVSGLLEEDSGQIETLVGEGVTNMAMVGRIAMAIERENNAQDDYYTGRHAKEAFEAGTRKGRPPMETPDNFFILAAQWQRGNISARDAAKWSQPNPITHKTFFSLCERYGIKQGDPEITN